MLANPSDLDVVMRLGAAVLCGGVIGIERDWRNMPTGFRTLAIVGLGSCVAVIAAIKAGDSDGFSRVAQGIVTGIGFLGGGVIVQNGSIRDVKGLTTAAAVWLTAALGLLCGVGELILALCVTIFAVAVLLLDNVLQSWRPKPSPSTPQPKPKSEPGADG